MSFPKPLQNSNPDLRELTRFRGQVWFGIPGKFLLSFALWIPIKPARLPCCLSTHSVTVHTRSHSAAVITILQRSFVFINNIWQNKLRNSFEKILNFFEVPQFQFSPILESPQRAAILFPGFIQRRVNALHAHSHSVIQKLARAKLLVKTHKRDPNLKHVVSHFRIKSAN